MNKPQIFLLHFAGGNKYSLQFLKPLLEDRLDFQAIELPGRGARFDENILLNKDLAIKDYVTQIKSLRNGLPYLIYGHSMGATLGLEVTKAMEELNDAPFKLVVSGNAGPRVGEKKDRYLLGHDEFIEELKTLGGVPTEVLEHKELLEIFIPIIRADFEVLEKENREQNPEIINAPILSIMGRQEETSDQIDNWKNFTSGKMTSKLLEGNHFFIYQHKSYLANLILECYDASLVY